MGCSQSSLALSSSYPKINIHFDPIAMSANAKFYFGYGSNLWLDQMKRRCPHSAYDGVGMLAGYKWIINSRGYANVISVNDTDPDTDTVVYGLIYSLTSDDEKALDRNEGVPDSYTKEMMLAKFWPSEKGRKVDMSQEPAEKAMLVYIDRKRITEHPPKEEYVVRMNRGIEDAISLGVPSAYIEKYLRPFIPAQYSRSAEELAEEQAKEFRDELDP